MQNPVTFFKALSKVDKGLYIFSILILITILGLVIAIIADTTSKIRSISIAIIVLESVLLGILIIRPTFNIMCKK